MSKKLQLNRETLRHLTDEDLSDVAGGAASLKCQPLTQTAACPSGATWLQECESYNVPTCA